VKGLVVSPGFIDTHQHSLEIVDGRLAAQDGTTTHMELEFGRSPVAEAYDIVAERGGHPINYGFSTSWPMRRAEVMGGYDGEATFDGLNEAFFAGGGWGSKVSTPEQEKQILALIQKDLDDGAIAVGFPPPMVAELAHRSRSNFGRWRRPTTCRFRSMCAISPCLIRTARLQP
jgi:hypothetical protein